MGQFAAGRAPRRPVARSPRHAPADRYRCRRKRSALRIRRPRPRRGVRTCRSPGSPMPRSQSARRSSSHCGPTPTKRHGPDLVAGSRCARDGDVSQLSAIAAMTGSPHSTTVTTARGRAQRRRSRPRATAGRRRSAPGRRRPPRVPARAITKVGLATPRSDSRARRLSPASTWSCRHRGGRSGTPHHRRAAAPRGAGRGPSWRRRRERDRRIRSRAPRSSSIQQVPDRRCQDVR